MDNIFDYIKRSRYKKLITVLLVVFVLIVNFIKPMYLLKGGCYNELLWIFSGFFQWLTGACVIIIVLICISNFKNSWIVLLCLPLIALFISWCLSISINKITQKILWSKTLDEVTEVRGKKEIIWKSGHVTNQEYCLYVRSKMICDHPIYVTKETFERVNENDTIIINVSNINRNISRVKKLHPTPQDIEQCLNERSLYIDEDKSYLMLATVISKKAVENNKQGKRTITYYAKLRINDKMETSFIRVRGILKSDREEYESLKVGVPVMISLTEGKTKTVRVLDWQLTPADIEKYKTPVRVKERNK
ncbi:MAG: hypothetical protein E7069_12700 [Bacteroidales bacterium]|jgi:ABC-type transport system involved in multi-copper enzyme maturation permease subunit|nr:hypothetical protein [Bacteroidales bacterium]